MSTFYRFRKRESFIIQGTHQVYNFGLLNDGFYDVALRYFISNIYNYLEALAKGPPEVKNK